MLNRLDQRAVCAVTTLFGNGQLVNRFTDGFLGGVAEHLARPSIPRADSALERDRNERVGGLVEQQLSEGRFRRYPIVIDHFQGP